MKLRSLSISAAFAAVILMSGCSRQAQESVPATEQKTAGDSYQAKVPAAFASNAIQPGGRCFVDSVNRQAVSARYEIAGGGLLTIEGWAIDANATAAPFVAVELVSQSGGQIYYAPAQRVNRPGLGEALKNPALDQAGVWSKAALNGVPPGSYSVMYLVGGESSANRCEPNVIVVVK